MKIIILYISLGILFFPLNNNAQNVAINATGTALNTCAGLDVDFADKGLLIPRVALTATGSNAPIGATIVTSLIVYNTATAGIAPNNVIPGYYYWDGALWNRLTTGAVSLSGTTNYVVKFTGATAGGNSNIFDNGTNIGIGTAIPNTSAAVDITSTTGAFLLPRMTTVQRDALTATPGMMIFNTTTGTIQGYHKATLYNTVDQSQTLWNASASGTDMAQSFVAGSTGTLKSITLVISAGGGSPTLNIRSGAGIGGAILYSQVFTISAPVGDTQEFIFTTPVSLIAGNTYTFEFPAYAFGLELQNTNPYPSGNAYIGGGSQPGWDFYFQTKMDMTSSVTQWNNM